jgi:hypothetical protein
MTDDIPEDIIDGDIADDSSNGGFDPFRFYEEFGNRYLKDSFLKKEEFVREYGTKRVAIGVNVKTNRIFYVDLNHAVRIIFIGMPRSGKTFTLRGFVDRMKLAGYDIFYLSDVKDEFRSSARPVQAKFHKLLLPGEKPAGTKVITLRPTFFKKTKDEEPPEGNVWYSPDFREMKKSDFMTLFRAEDVKSVNQQMIFDGICDEIEKRKVTEISEIDAIIEEADAPDASKNALKYKLIPLKKSFFYEKEHVKNIVNAFKKGYSVAINFENYEDYNKSVLEFPQVVYSLGLQIVIHARRENQIKPIMIVVDEAPRFLPAESNPASKINTLESVERDGRYGVNFIFGVQDIKRCPPSLITTCRYIFLPYSADINTFKEVLTMCGFIRYAQNGMRDALFLKKRMKMYQWAIIDRWDSNLEINRIAIVAPLAPLTEHMEQKS